GWLGQGGHLARRLRASALQPVGRHAEEGARDEGCGYVARRVRWVGRAPFWAVVRRGKTGVEAGRLGGAPVYVVDDACAPGRPQQAAIEGCVLGEMREERGQCGTWILSGIRGFCRGRVVRGEGGEQD